MRRRPIYTQATLKYMGASQKIGDTKKNRRTVINEAQGGHDGIEAAINTISGALTTARELGVNPDSGDTADHLLIQGLNRAIADLDKVRVSLMMTLHQGK